VLSRVRSAPDRQWDGKTIAVFGRYDMPSDYPFKPAVGVANMFMDAEHMNMLARLTRDKAIFLRGDQTSQKVRDYAAHLAVWPDPSSIGVADGVAVIVMSRDSSTSQ